MVVSIFDQEKFEFPYLYKFPGQASDEKILFVTRENSSMLWLRLGAVALTSLVLLITGWWLGGAISSFSLMLGAIIQFLTILLSTLFVLTGMWWVSTLWRKSLCFVTTRRLAKYIYTTPFNRHILSLPLDQIVDIGAYTKGFLQAVFKLGTFTARSSASSSGVATDDAGNQRVNKKYFYIENVAIAEDLQHYIGKVLNAYHHHADKISSFRPFIPQLKGEKRASYMKQFPEYWS